MIRLAITLSEPRYRALEETAAWRSRISDQLIDQSLDFYGMKSREEAIELVRRARASSGLDEVQAMSLALGEA